MGSTDLFITPWFPEFDPNTMVVSQLPVWVCLRNLPLHFWSPQVLSIIGNSIGRFIKMDTDRMEEGIYTFACICVEVDLNKGLPDQIQLNYKQKCWTQILDYEYTAFRCKICRQIGMFKTHAQKPKRIRIGRRKLENNPRDGSSPHQALKMYQLRRKIRNKIPPFPKRTIRSTRSQKLWNMKQQI